MIKRDLFDKLYQPDTHYGSREDLNMAVNRVYNVHSAFHLINNIVENPQFNIDNDTLYAGQTIYKTIDIWHGQDLAHQFTSS